MSEPFTPVPLTAAQVRLRRAAHHRLLQAAGLQATLVQGPSRCAFAAHEVARCRVTVTPAARTWLATSNHEGRQFPQALGEAFALIDPALVVTVTMTAPPDLTSQMLTVTVGGPDFPTHVWHMNAARLGHIHPRTQEPAFKALDQAAELVRLYRLAHQLP